jgi:methylmalonyl-CoA carboxyltransferase large subunit
MKTELPDVTQLAAPLEAILRELSRLNERVAALEAKASPQRLSATEPAPMPAAPSPVPAVEELSEELILVIGAAVAAYLGKKAHVRQVRLVGSLPWAQQGRVTIQASHTLEGRAGRKQS